MTLSHKVIIPTLAVLVSGAMSGCVQYQWVHASKNMTQFHQDEYHCNIESNKVYPPVFKTVVKSQSYDKNSTVECRKDVRNRSICTQRDTGFALPSTEVVDANKDNRETLFKQCLYSHGWRLEKVEK